MRTTIGQLLVNEALPQNLRDYSRRIDKKEMDNLLTQIADKQPENYAKTAFGLKQFGDETAYLQGSSISLDDLSPLVDKGKAFKKAEQEVAGVKLKSSLSQKEKDSRTAQIYQALNKDLTKRTLEGALLYPRKRRAPSKVRLVKSLFRAW